MIGLCNQYALAVIIYQIEAKAMNPILEYALDLIKATIVVVIIIYMIPVVYKVTVSLLESTIGVLMGWN